MIKVYVMGALNSDACGYIQNMHKMIKAADELRRMGFAVYVPAFDFLMGLVVGTLEYKDYFDFNTPWLLASDIGYVLTDWESSKGTWKEIDIAQKNNIPVRFTYETLMADFGNTTEEKVIRLQGDQSKNEKLRGVK